MKTATINSIKCFSLFNASGKVEELTELPLLPLYCKVYNYGAYMSETVGAVISGPDANGTYQTVNISEYTPGYNRIDKYSRPHSKKFGIGSYYSDSFECYTEAEVQEAIQLAEAQKVINSNKAKEAEEAKRAEIAGFPALYPHLKPFDRNSSIKSLLQVKANVIADLRKHFPKQKFSITTERDNINIRWEDGVKRSDVDSVVNKYCSHSSDYSGDYYDYTPSNFNNVYGGCKFLFTSRNMSEHAKEKFTQFFSSVEGLDMYQRDQLPYKVFCKYEVYEGFTISRVEGITCGSREDFYQVVNVDLPKGIVSSSFSEVMEVRMNEEKQGIEVIFPNKPSETVLSILKGAGFRWSRFGSLWYAKNTAERMQVVESLTKIVNA